MTTVTSIVVLVLVEGVTSGHPQLITLQFTGISWLQERLKYASVGLWGVLCVCACWCVCVASLCWKTLSKLQGCFLKVINVNAIFIYESKNWLENIDIECHSMDFPYVCSLYLNWKSTIFIWWSHIKLEKVKKNLNSLSFSEIII